MKEYKQLHITMNTSNQKCYAPPCVVETVRVLLEQDLLQASSMGNVTATGHEVEEVNAFESSAWD
jgi:hypothetical protein